MGAPRPDWWIGIPGALFGALIGSSVPYMWARWRRRTERRGEIQGMLVELLTTYDVLLGIMKSVGVHIPLSLLPISISQQALPKLIGDGMLTLHQTTALVLYVNRVEELNRSFVRARQAQTEKNLEAGKEENFYNRIRVKTFLYEPHAAAGGGALFDTAKAVLESLTKNR